MTAKNVYIELQKLSLALFLAAKGSVEQLFISDDNQRVSHSFRPPARQDGKTDPRIAMHARYFYNRWQLLREHSSASNSQLIIEAWCSYCNDCLTEQCTLPLLDLVQGWLLIDTRQPHSKTCCFAEDAVLPSDNSILRLCLAKPTELSPTIRKHSSADHCSCPGVICQAQAVAPDE